MAISSFIKSGGTIARNTGGGVPWTPADITTDLWLDADDAATITESGGSVSQWDDKSGGAFHFSQATASKQPTTGLNTIGGLNVINFDGLVEWMQSSANPWGSSVSDGFVIMLHRTPSTLTAGENFNMGGTSTASEAWKIAAPNTAGAYVFDAGGETGTNRITGASSTVAVDENLITSAYCSTTDSVQEVRYNGEVNVSDATGHTVNFTSNPTLMCRFPDWVEQNGDVAELVAIKGTVSTDTRQRLEGYLAHKWGLEGNLDAGHPYKSAPPTV